MLLSKIKEKYKDIIEDPEQESEKSDEEWQTAYSRMKVKRRRQVLAESQCLNRTISVNSAVDDTNLLKVKEKLAQALTNLGKKDTEIEELKRENIKSKQQYRLLEQQVVSLKDKIQQKQNEIIEYKTTMQVQAKNIEEIEKNVQSQKMDKELLLRQIEFYQQQIDGLKAKNEQKQQKITELKKQLKMVDKHKQQNQRMKIDISRMKQLLAESDKFKFFAVRTENKHFIGRPIKQSQCWVSQSLIDNTENFLKKHQVGYGNKQFLRNLVKFISKNMDNAKITTEKKVKKVCDIKLKEKQRKLNHSLNIMQMRGDELKRSRLGSSVPKSRIHTLNDSKMLSECLKSEQLQKSWIEPDHDKIRDVCLEILQSFKKGFLDLMQEKEIKRNRLTKLVDWLVEAVSSILPRRLSSNPCCRLEAQDIKICL